MGHPARKRSSEPVLRPVLPFSGAPPHTAAAPEHDHHDDHHDDHHPQHHHARAHVDQHRAATEEEVLLARSLRDRWRFRGALPFVLCYGWEAVRELVEIVDAEVAAGGVENPPAFLRWLAREEGAGR